MKQRELIEHLAYLSGVPPKGVAAVLVVLAETIATLDPGERVRHLALGTFSVATRPASKGRNPWNGAEIDIAAKRLVKFRAGKQLSERLNQPQPAGLKQV